MSFFISDKQHLASAERRSDYKPFKVDDENCQPIGIDVNFGHPLYTAVSDIFAVKCNVLHNITLPVIPDGCIAMVFYGREEDMKGKLCGAIDEIKKIELRPGELLLMLKSRPDIVNVIWEKYLRSM